MDGNRSLGKLMKRRCRSKSTRVSKGARRDREPSRLPWKKILNLFNKNKAIKSVPHSSALKNILSFDYQQKRKAYLKEYMATRGRNNEFRISKTELCKERNQKILKKQENIKGGHLIDAKNQILIISEN
ncbi:hypothetical protein P5673_031227 [Acropora cervicornis]|uniref:Uncharacterized protein n=1 Tax=Acropora cervicornis TaxID=6130 RepID=A0AAD9PT06_ACRCE|nr:hypothetical protein P5673_031227 [Acropora cervicornis]